MTKKNFIALFFTTDFLTRRLKLGVLTLLIGFIPLPAIAKATIEVSPGYPEGDLITLKVKVLNNENIPIEGLSTEEFKLQTAKIEKNDSQGNPINLNFSPITNFRLLEPGQESQLDPTYVVILLDMSGSMGEKDSSSVRKFDGAISAIRGFIKLVRDDGLPVQIALVPFGVDRSGGKCNYDVNKEIIAQKLIKVTDPKLDEQVNQLAGSEPCSGTNLYDPLKEAVKFLGTPNQFSQTFNPNTENPVPPRLSVILFSDGYHNHRRENEDEQFTGLVDVLQQYPQVRVNTLGYGESLRQLRDRAINCRISDNDLTKVEGVNRIRKCRLSNGGDISNFIVDEPRLKKIAQTTGGISQFPKNANEAVSSLETFFKSLRSYQLQYKQPKAEAADRYKVIVSVDSPNRQLELDGEPQIVRIPNFIFYQLPLIPDRLIIFGATLAALTLTIKRFMGWSRKLKQEAQRWL